MGAGNGLILSEIRNPEPVDRTSVWDLSTGSELSLPGEAWGFADDGRLVIVVRHDRGFLLPSWLPPWVATLPLIRHGTSSGPRSQLLLVDATTGQQRYASAGQPRIDFVATSRDGLRLATSSPSGRVCVWDVPR